MKHKDGSADKYKDKHKEKRKEEKVTYFVEDKVWGMLCVFSFQILYVELCNHVRKVWSIESSWLHFNLAFDKVHS